MSAELSAELSAATTAPVTALSDSLGRLLSRLAGLQGQAVPAFRFQLLEHSRDGILLSELPCLEQVRECWLSRFPEGTVTTLSVDALSPGCYPLLWLSPADGHAYLLQGRLSTGIALAQDEAGARQELDSATLAAGTILQLHCQRAADPHHETAPVTARDWFAYALGKRRRVFVEAVLASFLISLLALFAAMYSMQVYDRVVPTRGYSTLWVLTIGVLLAVSMEFLMKQARSWIIDRASKQIDKELSDVFFAKALDIRMDARPATVGTFASQIRQFESVRTFMTTLTLFALADAPFALLFIGVIAILAGPVALVPLVMIPVSVLVGWLATRRIPHYMSKHMEESNQKNGLLIEAIDGIESIKACGAAWKVRDRHRDLVTSMAENDIRLRQLSTRANNLTQSLQQVNNIALTAAGAYAITQGSLTMGGLIACSMIAGRALGPVAQVPQLISQWHSSRIALKSLDGIMAMPGEREEGQRQIIPERCDGVITLEKVAFGYSEERPALELEKLQLRAGERVAIVGSVGSGKSTLVKLLSGLYLPKRGCVRLDGVEMNHLAPEYLSEQIGYLPQDVRLFHGTLRENLTLGLPTPSDDRLLRAAQATGLDQVIASHPQGLEMRISEGGQGLSGGQRQLVGLTRLLLARPKIMLLDEPTSSMDGVLESRVMRHLFQEIAPDSLLVVVTHKPAVLPHVGRIIVVDRGRVAVDDTREKVMAMMQQPVKAQPAAVKVAP